MSVILIGSVILGLLGAYLLSWTGPSPIIKLLVSIGIITSLVLSSGYVIADQLTGNGIDSSIVFHLTAGMAGAPILDFLPQIIAGGVVAIVAILAGIFVYRRMGDWPLYPAAWRKYIGITCVLLSLVTSPGAADLVRLTSAMMPASGTAPDAFLAIDDAGPAEDPKNFILLFVEQLERSYFDEDIFPGLLPNMTALADEGIVFTNIGQVTGSSWSIAGMTSGLCGVPLVGTGASNSMSGMDQFMPLAVCMGDLLQAKGYRLEHLVGSDLDFAGWNKFFLGHGFESVDGLAELAPDLPDDTVYSNWGLHDETLLSVATERLQTLAEGDRPYGMVLNMLDTHHPSGYPSPACQAQPYGDGEIKLLTAFACSDRLVTQWLEDLRGRGLLDDTVVMISSDHLSMPNDVWDRLQGLDRHNFVMVLGDDIAPAEVDRAGSTLDLGTTLLNLIGFDVPGIGLGRNLLSDPATDPDRIADIEGAIHASRGYISSLWSFPGLVSPATFDVAARKLQLGDREVSVPALLRFDEDGTTTDMNFEFYETTPLWTHAFQMQTGQKFLWFDECRDVARVFADMEPVDDMLCAAYGTYGSTEIWGARFDEAAVIDFSLLRNAVFSPQDGVPDIGRRLVPATDAQTDDTSFDVVSSTVQPDYSYIKARYGTEILFLPRGVSVVGLRDDGSATMLGMADTCSYALPADDLPELGFSVTATVEAYKARFDTIAVVVHDSAVCDRYTLDTYFAGSDFSAWDQIGHRTPYVGLRSADGRVVEKGGETETSISVSTGQLGDD